MIGHRRTLGLVFFCIAPLLHAQAPELARVIPRSAHPGGTLDITLSGNNLVDPGKLWTSFGGDNQWMEAISPKGGAPQKADPKKLLGKLTLPSDAPLGLGFLRLPTRTGMSGPLFFLVDDLPVAVKRAQNSSRKEAQELTLPRAVEGSAESGRSDFYKVTLKAGESISLEVFANRIGSKMDPVLRLVDGEGNEILAGDDTPGLAGDCRLRFRATGDGTFFIEIRDAAFSGGDDFFYHLRAGDFPLVANLFPPVASPGTTVEVQAVGEAVEGVTPLKLDVPASASGDIPVSVRFGPDKPAAFAQLRVESSAVHVQREPEDTAPKTLPDEGGLTVFGRLIAPAQSNTFLLCAKKDDKITLTPILRGIGSPAILYVAVHDEKGAFIAGNDIAGNGTSNEVPLKFRAPKDGFYRVLVEDVARRGGPGFIYGVLLERTAFELELAASSERFVAPRSGAFSTKITAQRKGFNGPISIEPLSSDGTPLPEGFRWEQNVIEKGKNDTQLKVFVPKDVPAGTLYHIKMAGFVEEGGNRMRVAVTPPKADVNKPAADAFSASLQAMPQPPRLLLETFPLCVGPEAPDFFSIELTENDVRLPNVIGKGSFIVRQKSIDPKYDGNAHFSFEGLPSGVSVQSGPARGGRIAGQVDFICEVSGPPDLAVASHSFEIIATAEHKGVQKEVRLKKVALKIVPPLEITGTAEAPIAPGKRQTLKIAVNRFDKTDPQLVEVALKNLPDGITGPEKMTLQPAQTEVVLELEACEAAIEGQYQTLRLDATTRVNGVDVAVQSLPVRLEVKK